VRGQPLAKTPGRLGAGGAIVRGSQSAKLSRLGLQEPYCDNNPMLLGRKLPSTSG